MNFRLANRSGTLFLSRFILSPGWASTWNPTAEKLAALTKPREWILQKKVQYAEFVPTPTAEIKGRNPDDVYLAG